MSEEEPKYYYNDETNRIITVGGRVFRKLKRLGKIKESNYIKKSSTETYNKNDYFIDDDDPEELVEDDNIDKIINDVINEHKEYLESLDEDKVDEEIDKLVKEKLSKI